jgi:hypothetical protein
MNTIDKGEDVTNLVAPKRMRVDPAHLPPAKKVSTNNNNNNKSAAAPEGQWTAGMVASEVEDMRKRCTLYRLLTDNSPEGVRELSEMVVIAKNCLTQQGILPINTSDDNDAREADQVLSNLLSDRFRAVFRRCYLLGVLTVCPIFLNMLTAKYNVSAAKLDSFVNNPESHFSIDYNNYAIGKIRDANMLVARVAKMWLQFGGASNCPSGGADPDSPEDAIELIKK